MHRLLRSSIVLVSVTFVTALPRADASTLGPQQVTTTGANLFWDADGGATAVTGGTGNWVGGNTWRLNASNGTLQAWEDANRATFGGTAGVVSLNTTVSATGLTFSTGGYTISGGGSLTVTSNTSGAGTQALQTTSSGTTTIGVPVVLGAAAGSTQTFSIGSGSTLIVNADITQANSGIALSKSASGTLILNGNNSYSGGIDIGSGVVAIGSDTALGSGTVTFSSGTTLQSADGNARTIANVWTPPSGPSTITFGASGTGNLTLSDTTNFSLGTTVKTFTVNNATTTLGKAFTSSASGGGLAKAGPGTLVVTGTSTYAGPTSVSEGTLRLANTTAAAITTSSRLTVNSGGTLQMGANNQLTSSVPVTFGSGGLASATLNAGGFSQGSNATPGIGALTLSSNSTIDLTNNSLVHFAASTAVATGSLSILNWNGLVTTNAATGGSTTDLLRFGTTNADLSFLANIQFVDPVINGVTTPGTYAAMFASLNPGEIVPNALAPIPEPTTWVGAGLALVAIGISQRKALRKRLKG